MSDRDIMLKALNKSVIKDLLSQGFTGKYPHFKRRKDDFIELVSFFTNKYGGSFTVEVSAVFPNSSVTNLSDITATVDEDEIEVACTNERYRLEGMFDGWFYYRDVYRMPGGFYHDVSEKEKDTFKPSKGWTLLQAFDELAAEEICEEISLQLDDAFDWLYKFESKKRKSEARKEGRKPQEEKVINKRIFGFIVVFIIFLLSGLLLFAIDKVIGIILLCISLMQLIIMYLTPVSYIFSQERLIIKYLFGREENTTWGRVYAVTPYHENPLGFIYLKGWQLYYFSENSEKKKMWHSYAGRISKNDKTTALMKKYCPKKID